MRADPGHVFVGLMFLGMGIGYLIGQTAAGLFVGMGLGFLAMAFLKGEERKEREKERGAEVGLLVVGVLFLIGGLMWMFNLWAYVSDWGPIVLILLGLAFLITGIRRERVSETSR